MISGIKERVEDQNVLEESTDEQLDVTTATKTTTTTKTTRFLGGLIVWIS